MYPVSHRGFLDGLNCSADYYDGCLESLAFHLVRLSVQLFWEWISHWARRVNIQTEMLFLCVKVTAYWTAPQENRLYRDPVIHFLGTEHIFLAAVRTSKEVTDYFRNILIRPRSICSPLRSIDRRCTYTHIISPLWPPPSLSSLFLTELWLPEPDGISQHKWTPPTNARP